jgi:hypothetical protein
LRQKRFQFLSNEMFFSDPNKTTYETVWQSIHIQILRKLESKH